jgi:anti-sigma regulatory factor (Ser/Thr protein kinase)
MVRPRASVRSQLRSKPLGSHRQSPTRSPQFNKLRWRLLLSSLGVISLTLGAAAIGVYQYVAYSLVQKTDQELASLANAAAKNISDIKANRAALYSRIPRPFDDDGDLDIPWQDLRQKFQGVEWFDREGHLLISAGNYLVPMPLVRKRYVTQLNGMRILTQPAYAAEPAKPGDSEAVKPRKILQGYVRTSEPVAEIESELERLRWGLGWSGLVALVGCGVGSWWLTRQSLQPIEQSFQRLRQFTADASHELRSPLTAIHTSVEVMQSHPERIHPADVHKLAVITSATAQMTQLIEDLLLLARTDGSTLHQPNSTVVPLDELLEELVDSFAPQAEAKAIVLKADLAIATLVKGDVNQLKRAFYNLLANALQYTPAGEKVTVESFTQDNWITVKITDTGIGIAPEHLSLVFDRFWRADQARTRRAGGSGLGLAIVQGIVRSHRGEITVSSKLEVGSCFQIHLPLA